MLNKGSRSDSQPLSSVVCHLSSVLIANRGEIASRIIRTCRKMGIKSIAVFSEADRQALFVAEADMAVYIGESNPAASYLNQEVIIAAAKKVDADAIHPGYGFLSENAGFARRCIAEGLIFVGPHPEAIEAMGSKAKAKTLMVASGVPVIPGYQGADQTVATLANAAKDMGFPVLLKATAGGGGKGMRIVHAAEEVESAIEAAKREALSAFGDEELIIEKYIESGRHIEFQIFGDQHGNAIHILERECSIQRRYQKVIEESPSPIMDEALRARMGEAAVQAALTLKYDNAGTVEFIYDENSGDFYFLEVNTRLQVEHPVTEEITGLDLVQLQLESAMGLPLSVKQEEIQPNGYAVEARLYAEDAANGFLPVTGTIQRFEIPEVDGLRVETAVGSGAEISIYYDPMIAKIIVWDKNRVAAHRKLQFVLRQLVCLGTKTNQDFLLLLTQHPDFLAGQYDTHFIQDKIDLSALESPATENLAKAAIAATLQGWRSRQAKRNALHALPSGWRNSFYEYQKVQFQAGETSLDVQYRYQEGAFHFRVAEEEYEVSLLEGSQNTISLEINGIQYRFHIAQVENQYFLQQEAIGSVLLEEQDRFPVKKVEQVPGGYEAPMPSQIVKILVTPGQEVQAGDPLVILSSMKMENTLTATTAGKVEEIYAKEGANVAAGFLLLQLVAS